MLYFACTVHVFETSLSLPTDVLCLVWSWLTENMENRATCQSLRLSSLAPLANTSVSSGSEAKSWVSPASGDYDYNVYNPLISQ